MTQNASDNQGGINKAADKSADRKRKEPEGRRDTEARSTPEPGMMGEFGAHSKADLLN
jgi:hypothetical protein